jgi:hypothetical protein
MAEQGNEALNSPKVRATRARKHIDEEATEARRLVLGARSRLRPARVAPTVTEDRALDAGELGDVLRRMAGDLEEETARLRDEAAKLRSEAADSATALHDELQRAAEAIAEQSTEEVDREVGPTVAEAVAALTEQLGKLEIAASTLVGAVERLGSVGPAVEKLASIVPAVGRLERIAAQPPPQPVTGPLADALGELSTQLLAVSGAIRDQVQDAVEQALIADARRRDAAMTQALGRLTEEFLRLRQQLGVPMRQPAATEAAKKQPAKKRAAKKRAAKKQAPPADAS